MTQLCDSILEKDTSLMAVQSSNYGFKLTNPHLFCYYLKVMYS